VSSPRPEAFGADELRASTLRAWHDSPTRLVEDTNAEQDLRVGGYRDRLFVELAQNAADAAAQAGVPGRIRVSLVDGELRVANTGAPLDSSGVAALSSLRASAKREGTVGRFGVGFAAVLAVSAEPRVVSTTGGVAFSETGTRKALGRAGGAVPVLRLPWAVPPTEAAVPAGYDTEVRLPLREGVDGGALLEGLAEEVDDLLLALPSLARIEVGDAAWSRADAGRGIVELTLPEGGVRRWFTHGGAGFVWAVPVAGDGTPHPLESDVLHAPTPTDERLSLPARLLASVPVEPSRRRVLAGEGTREALAAAATGYPDLLRAFPARHRLALVPRARFPLSDVDAELRDLVTARLADTPWLPSAAGPDLRGARAMVLGAGSPELTALLADAVPDLVAAPLCGPEAARVLAVAGTSTLGIAEVVDAVTGLARPPSWWRSLYEALAPLLDARGVAEGELGALPVPLADGRTVPGPRGALLVGGAGELLDELAEVDVVGLRLVHPDSAHPLLERLGATRAGPGEVLDALRDAVERSAEDARSGLDTGALATAVLRLVAATGAGERDWLGALALPEAGSGQRRADELVLPTSPLLPVLDPEALGEDGPLAVLDEDFARGWPAEVLTATGVLDTFVVIQDEEPAEPAHDLPDEAEWWDATPVPPSRIEAVRDLDLVAEDRWPAALRLLAGDPRTWRALTLPGGHTRWWIARFATLAGVAPAEWRLPAATALAGLYDPVPDLGLRPEVLAAAGVRAALTIEDAEDLADLLDRLGDPGREVGPGLAARAHSALVTCGLTCEEPPDRVRAADGSVADAEDAAVLDRPWLAGVWPAGRLVAPGTLDRAPALAELLDLPLAGERTKVKKATGNGEPVPWSELPAAGVVAELLGFALPEGEVVLHEALTVEWESREHRVRWWVDGTLHAEDVPDGLGRALAWAADRWAERYRIVALLDDPEPATVWG
jgi:hypothetical protein